MLRTFFRRLMTPGGTPLRHVCAVGALLMLGIFTLDIATGSVVRLHILYIFPIAMISIHCSNTWLVFLGVLLSVFLQGAGLMMYEIPTISVFFELMVAVLSFILTIALARGLRINFLETARLAAQDALTGLPNRRSIDESVSTEIARQKRYGGFFSLVLIDLDNFKQLNDSKGHQGGDNALLVLVSVLREQTRQSDIIGRLGGDEFAVVMPNMSAVDCDALCQKLVDEIAKRMTLAGFPVTASIGYASFRQAPASSDEALQKADKALYKAKANGKCCVVGL